MTKPGSWCSIRSEGSISVDRVEEFDLVDRQRRLVPIRRLHRIFCLSILHWFLRQFRLHPLRAVRPLDHVRATAARSHERLNPCRAQNRLTHAAVAATSVGQVVLRHRRRVVTTTRTSGLSRIVLAGSSELQISQWRQPGGWPRGVSGQSPRPGRGRVVGAGRRPTAQRSRQRTRSRPRRQR